jgi:hypothetical protein
VQLEAQMVYVVAKRSALTPEIKASGPLFVTWLETILDCGHGITLDGWADAEEKELGLPVYIGCSTSGGQVIHEAVEFILEGVCTVECNGDYEFDDFSLSVEMTITFL